MATTLVAVLVAGVGVAQAAVTSSSITSPSSPFYALNQGQTQNVTISGTSNGTSSDTVDIDCYADNGSTGTKQLTIAANVAVAGNGSFSTSVPLSALTANGSSFKGACQLRALPHGSAATTGLGAFAGIQTMVGYVTPEIHNSKITDYDIFVPQAQAIDEYDDLGGCGLDNTYLMDPTTFGSSVDGAYDCNDWAAVPAQSDASRPGLEVDGQPAYVPENLEYVGISNFPAITINSVTQDPSDGNVTIDETEPIDRCPGNAFPPTNSNCANPVPSGVQLHRIVTQSNAGRTVAFSDSYESTDAAAHTMSLLLENDEDFTATSRTDLGYEFPGQSSFAPVNGGDTVSVPAGAPASIYIENLSATDGTTAARRGAITYGQTPSGPFAFEPGSFGYNVFDAPNAFTVPSTGAYTVGYTYDYAYSLATVQNDVQTIDASYAAPTIAITSPADQSTVNASPITVTGTAAAGGGVQSVTVDGMTATLSGNTFTATIPVSLGANTIAAVVTSNDSRTASTSETVSYQAPTSTTTTSPPVTPSTPPTATTPPPPTVGVDVTTPGQKIKGQSAVLGGTVAAHSAAVTYRFQFGSTQGYGKLTAARTLAATTSSQAVHAAIGHLIPGRVYHYRLMVTNPTSAISYGADMALRTPRVAPARVRDHISHYRELTAPYAFRVHEQLRLPKGLTHKVACQTHGYTVIKLVLNGRQIAHRRVRLNAACIVNTTFRLTATQLPGTGNLWFHMRFGGNHQLTARPALTLRTIYGKRR